MTADKERRRLAAGSPTTAALGALRKLRHRSAGELYVRGSQAATAWMERIRLSVGAASLVARRADLRNGGSLAGGRFFASFDDPQATVDAVRRHWPDAADDVIAGANEVVAGRFNLLGGHGLSFGSPIDWHLDPVARIRMPLIHWSRIPLVDPAIVGDYELVWELNRHQHFLGLGQAYWLTGKEQYAETFVEHLEQWMAANPPTVGVNWASSLEVAFRSISWLWGLHFFRRAPALTTATVRRAIAFLELHARHIERYLSTYCSPNTKLTGEALGLVYIGTLLPQLKRAERWRQLGWRILTEQLARHVLSDGVYYERTSCYHRYTTDIYLHALLLAERNALPDRERFVPRVLGLLEHLLHLEQPDGSTPFIGDDDGGRLAPLAPRAANDFRDTLAVGGALFSRADLCRGRVAAAPEAAWLLGPEGVRRLLALAPSPSSTVAPSRAFPAGGYFVMRDGWTPDANHSVFDCGPQGADNCGHAHADALSLQITALGQPMIVDPGTFTYTASAAARDHFRGTGAHSTVIVDDTPASIPDGLFSWKQVANGSLHAWHSTDRFDFVEGSHEGYLRLSPAARHRRAVLFLKRDYWIVSDRVESDGPHHAMVRWQLAPGISASDNGPASAVSSGVGITLHNGKNGRAARLRIASFGSGGEYQRLASLVSPGYGQLADSLVLALPISRRHEPSVVTVLAPYGAAAWRPVIEEHPAERGVVLRVDPTPYVTDLLLIGASGARSTLAGAESDAAWAWVRRASAAGGGSEVLEFLIIGGTRLHIDGVVDVCVDGPAGGQGVHAFVAGRRTNGGWNLETQGESAVRIDVPAAAAPFGAADGVLAGVAMN